MVAEGTPGILPRVGSVRCRRRSERASPGPQYPLDTAIRYEPDQGTEHVYTERYPRRPKRGRNRERVERRREFALPISADGLFQEGVRSLRGDDRLLQDEIGDPRHELYDAVERARRGGE